jgi:dienelactone hydrolase
VKLNLLVALLVMVVGSNALAATPPAALYQDPPTDTAYPASGMGLQIPSQDQAMNAMLYRPAGPGPHPVAILFHGLPGNEQNLDLAQALRRAGWAVVTVHYRGSWGSAGTFSFDGAVQDGAAVVDWAQDPANAKALRLDPRRIVVLGHSMGGYVTARVCAAHPELLGCVLLAPWDLSADAPMAAAASPAERDRLAATDFNDIDGRLTGASARSILDTLASDGQRWSLGALAPDLAQRRLLIVTASRDSEDDKALALLPPLRGLRPASLRVESLDTDHGFNDQRIALETLVLEWVAALPGAPALK